MPWLNARPMPRIERRRNRRNQRTPRRLHRRGSGLRDSPMVAAPWSQRPIEVHHPGGPARQTADISAGRRVAREILAAAAVHRVRRPVPAEGIGGLPVGRLLSVGLLLLPVRRLAVWSLTIRRLAVRGACPCGGGYAPFGAACAPSVGCSFDGTQAWPVHVYVARLPQPSTSRWLPPSRTLRLSRGHWRSCDARSRSAPLRPPPPQAMTESNPRAPTKPNVYRIEVSFS